jgi:hypothetical protein
VCVVVGRVQRIICFILTLKSRRELLDSENKLTTKIEFMNPQYDRLIVKKDTVFCSYRVTACPFQGTFGFYGLRWNLLLINQYNEVVVDNCVERKFAVENQQAQSR